MDSNSYKLVRDAPIISNNINRQSEQVISEFSINWKYVIIALVLLILFCFIYKCLTANTNEDEAEFRDLHWVDDNSLPTFEEAEEAKEEELNNIINVRFANSPLYLNAQVIVKTPNNSYYKEFSPNKVGLTENQARMITFEIGNDKSVDEVRIRTMYGNDITFNNPEVNSTLNVGFIKKDVPAQEESTISNTFQPVDTNYGENDVVMMRYDDLEPKVNKVRVGTKNDGTRYPIIEYEPMRKWRRFDHIRY